MATVIFRPNGDGNQNGWNAEGGDWQRVDEVTSDGDATRLYTPTADAVSTFAMQDSSESGIINQIEVIINTRGVDAIEQKVQLALRTSSTDYFSADQTYNNTSYHEESNVWTTNPNTASAWTWSEIDALECGMKRISGGGQAVTQVWVVVTYTSASFEQEGFRFRNDDGSENTATWAASQDTNVTEPHSTNLRLRMLLNTTNDSGSDIYQLEYKEKISGSYLIVPIDTVTYGSELTSGGTPSASAETQPAEGSDEAFDGSSGTKWLVKDGAVPEWLKYQFGASATHLVGKYAITSANDDDTRDPKDWQLQGSNDDSGWTTVDTVSGETFASRGLRKEFICDTPGSTKYEYYRLYITANNGATGTFYLQLAELELYPILDQEIFVSTSANITASGENTTVQLTAPSGKTTGDFDAGRIQDDENPADPITISSDDYTEIEWCLQADASVDGETFQFRIARNGFVLDTYTVTPEWLIGTAGVTRRVFLIT